METPDEISTGASSGVSAGKIGLKADSTKFLLLKERKSLKPVTVQAPGNDTRRDSTVAECQEWLDDLALFQEVVQRRSLTDKYAVAIRYWDFHFRGYSDYLTHRAQYRSYADYIDQHRQVK